jgi:2-dehydro-3-deoxygluconokinase
MPAGNDDAVSMRVACFGELLLRLSAPGRELLLQTPRLDVHMGGAEANVAVSLAALGHTAAMISVVADNALGEACLGELRRRQVAASAVARRAGRMGLYFLSHGGSLRPSEITYDRAESVFARCDAADFDFAAALEGADWLHLSGVTPALGERPAAAALAAVRAAASRGVKVSFDCNYRPSLWAAWNGDAASILRGLAAHADLLFADDRALALILDAAASGTEPSARFEELAVRALDTLPRAQRIATTVRTERSVDDHSLGGLLATSGGIVRSATRHIGSIVDRIGSGDAFAAGLVHGLAVSAADAAALDFAVAAACLKHSVPGDANLVGRAEIEALLAGGGYGVRR